MNEKPHTHELEFFRHRDSYVGVYGKIIPPDPTQARFICYGDQERHWPQLKEFSRKQRRHWWSPRKRLELLSLHDRQELLQQARQECIREIVTTHDTESIRAGERDVVRQTNLQQYTNIIETTATKAWND